MANTSVLMDEDFSQINQNRPFGLEMEDPDPDKYLSVDRTTRPELAGRKGIRGAIVPVHTEGGRPRGFDPHAPQIINVDPMFPGCSSVVDLAKVTSEMMEQAIADTHHPDPEVAASLVFRKLAVSTIPVKTWIRPDPAATAEESAESVVEMPPPGLNPPRLTPPTSLTNLKAAPPAPPPQPIHVPAPALTPALTASRADLFFPVSPSVAATADRPPVAPGCSVVIEVKGFGAFQTAYHKAVKDGIHLVLVYDTRWRGGTKYVPQVFQEPIVVEVASHGKVYLARSCGIHFAVDEFEYTVLLIEQETDIVK